MAFSSNLMVLAVFCVIVRVKVARAKGLDVCASGYRGASIQLEHNNVGVQATETAKQRYHTKGFLRAYTDISCKKMRSPPLFSSLLHLI